MDFGTLTAEENAYIRQLIEQKKQENKPGAPDTSARSSSSRIESSSPPPLQKSGSQLFEDQLDQLSEDDVDDHNHTIENVLRQQAQAKTGRTASPRTQFTPRSTASNDTTDRSVPNSSRRPNIGGGRGGLYAQLQNRLADVVTTASTVRRASNKFKNKLKRRASQKRSKRSQQQDDDFLSVMSPKSRGKSPRLSGNASPMNSGEHPLLKGKHAEHTLDMMEQELQPSDDDGYNDDILQKSSNVSTRELKDRLAKLETIAMNQHQQLAERKRLLAKLKKENQKLRQAVKAAMSDSTANSETEAELKRLTAMQRDSEIKLKHLRDQLQAKEKEYKEYMDESRDAVLNARKNNKELQQRDMVIGELCQTIAQLEADLKEAKENPVMAGGGAGIITGAAMETATQELYQRLLATERTSEVLVDEVRKISKRTPPEGGAKAGGCCSSRSESSEGVCAIM